MKSYIQPFGKHHINWNYVLEINNDNWWDFGSPLVKRVRTFLVYMTHASCQADENGYQAAKEGHWVGQMPVCFYVHSLFLFCSILYSGNYISHALFPLRFWADMVNRLSKGKVGEGRRGKDGVFLLWHLCSGYNSSIASAPMGYTLCARKWSPTWVLVIFITLSLQSRGAFHLCNQVSVLTIHRDFYLLVGP